MTKCGVIGKVLVVSVCPLKPGECMFQHRVTHVCRYTEAELSPEEFNKRVGLAEQDPKQLQEVRQQILLAVKHELDCK